MGFKLLIMVHNSYQNVTTCVTILFEPQKGPLWAKKGIFKPKKDLKHLQKKSYGFEMINYDSQYLLEYNYW